PPREPRTPAPGRTDSRSRTAGRTARRARGAPPDRRASRRRRARAGLLAVARGASRGVVQRCTHESAVQRRRTVRARLELGVVLRGDEERVLARRQLDRLDELIVRRGAADDEARILD